MAPHPEPLGGVLFEKVLQPYVVNKLGRTVYDDMRRMESIVTASDLVWTIARPSGLCTATDVSDYLVAADHVGHRFTTRIDLADCLLPRSRRGPPPVQRDRRRDAERPPIDAVADLAGRDPQAVMTQPPPVDSAIDDLWRAHHARMLQLTLRMLSDLGDAEDVVQEAFARLTRVDPTTLDDPEGWLVVVTGRLCLDRLRTRRRHPAEPLPGSSWPPGRAELPDVASTDPADHVGLVDSVILSMHVVLERLSPAERTSFVLHDVFHLRFEEISAIVGRSPAACRQLASQARRSVRDAANGRRFAVEDDVQRRVAERFFAACAGGDLAALLELLDPAVGGTGDVTGEPVVGADVVGPGILRYFGPRPDRACSTSQSASASASSPCATTRCWPSSC